MSKILGEYMVYKMCPKCGKKMRKRRVKKWSGYNYEWYCPNCLAIMRN